MDGRVALLYLISFAGFVMVAGGMWLLYKQKIYIDKESSQPIEVSLPGDLKFKSNYPALALFVLGFFPLVYPTSQFTKLPEYPHVVRIQLQGIPNNGIYPAAVYASVKPQAVLQDGDSFSVEVPFVGDARDQEYKVLLVANKQLLDTQTITNEVKSGSKIIPVHFTPAKIAQSSFQTVTTPDPGGYK